MKDISLSMVAKNNLNLSGSYMQKFHGVRLTPEQQKFMPYLLLFVIGIPAAVAFSGCSAVDKKQDVQGQAYSAQPGGTPFVKIFHVNQGKYAFDYKIKDGMVGDVSYACGSDDPFCTEDHANMFRQGFVKCYENAGKRIILETDEGSCTVEPSGAMKCSRDVGAESFHEYTDFHIPQKLDYLIDGCMIGRTES